MSTIQIPKNLKDDTSINYSLKITLFFSELLNKDLYFVLLSFLSTLCLSESIVQQRMGITLLSNLKITWLAQLQTGPHYIALLKRGRNTRPIIKKREFKDVRKVNIKTAGVALTFLWGERPSGMMEQGPLYAIICPVLAILLVQTLASVCSVFLFCYWLQHPVSSRNAICWGSCCRMFIALYQKHHTHTNLQYTFSCGQGWVRLGQCQRSLFT